MQWHLRYYGSPDSYLGSFNGHPPRVGEIISYTQPDGIPQKASVWGVEHVVAEGVSKVSVYIEHPNEKERRQKEKREQVLEALRKLKAEAEELGIPFEIPSRMRGYVRPDEI